MFVEGDEKTLFQCGVLYIGSAVPLEASKGLEAIQQPLRERYPYKDDKEISGVEAVLSVTPTGIQMQYLKDSGSVMWFPISSLTFCAAVRCIHLLTRAGQRVPRFVSLNSPAAGGVYSQKPVIFAAITRRTKGRKFLECHSFICKSTGDAIGLVQSSKLADRAFRNGIVPSSVPSLSRMNSLSLRPQSESELHLLTDQKSPQSDLSPEFQEPPPTQGYFYGTGSTLARSYTVEKMNNDVLRIPRTLDRAVSRRHHSSVMVPSHSHYIPGPRRVVPVPVNISQSSRRFLSPPPSHILIRKDPYLFNSQSTLPTTYARLPPPLAPSISEKVGRSPSLVRSQRSSAGSTIRPEDNALRNSRKDTAIKNGRDTESSSGSSRPPSPPLDYEPFASALGGSKTHLSRKDRYEKGSFITSGAASPPSVIYPYDPYIYPAHLAGDPTMRPRSLSPPAAEIEHSTKNTRKKKEKSKKKSKKSAKKGSKDAELPNDNVEYSSEVLNGSDKQNRFMLDRAHAFQNERAFARSIAAESKKHGIYDQENTSYRHYPDSDLVN
ncbi:Hypothetical predicted protein [Octopus vulgaris]|uniref:PID domain-containing protein n=1 Tax=Octopus vulgaris TaxID=6645 RepID=A0AA36BVP9_OCTVU|nr:Hypothetical predicted protein [Octopus vulgaris]